jgi:hypothetical protein
MSYGFIITRHVNSESTNRYWNQSIKLLKAFYPNTKIVIIDDDSDPNFLKEDNEYKDLIIVQSEYPKRGELLPYIYYLNNKWFENAIIIHDSVFIHKKIAFDKITTPVIPLWHFEYDKENLPNLLRICSYLTNNHIIKSKLNPSNALIYHKKIYGCFGNQVFINHTFLKNIQAKYNIVNMVNAINNRTDRCGLERVLGAIFYVENPYLQKYHSFFGRIQKVKNAFCYSYDDYIIEFNKRKIPSYIIKVWTGR